MEIKKAIIAKAIAIQLADHMRLLFDDHGEFIPEGPDVLGISGEDISDRMDQIGYQELVNDDWLRRQVARELLKLVD